MKTLVLLFACLAAVNAVSYVAPPACYQRWDISKYCVYPTFKFQVHYCGTWFSTKYYADILKIYPEDTCKEVSEDEFKKDCAAKLNGRLSVIYGAMSSHFYQWKAQLKSAVDAAKEKYNREVTAYYTGYIRYVWDSCVRQTYYTRKVTAINTYCARIDEMYSKAVDCYAAALNQAYQRIIDFHRQILDNSVKAFKTRLERIAEFDKSLHDRMYKYLVTYKNTMAKIIEKRADSYRALLYKVHCDNYWQKDNVNYVVDLFRNAEYQKCYRDADCYWSKLMTIKDQMMRSFRCNYKIITYSGVCSLARKQYQTYCQSLGTWWTFKTSRTIPCFRYVDYRFTWKACEYKNLVTCDVNTVVQQPSDFQTEMENKGKAAVDAAINVFAAWKSKWVGYHVEYYNKYVEIVEERHDFLCRYYRAQIYCRYGGFYGCYTDQFYAYKRSLEARKEEAIKKYQDMLWQRIAHACDTFNKRVAAYKKMVDEMVAKIVASYNAAYAARQTKIDEYQKKQEELRNKMRDALETKLVKIYNLKCDQYYELMMFYHGGQKLCGKPYDLWDSYKYKIYYEYRGTLNRFDAHWRELLPKLVMHYSCGYKINYSVKFCVPQLKCSFYSWQYTLPHTACYPYELSCYNTYCNYRLVQVGCRYYYKI